MEIIHIVLGKANPERMNGVNKVAYQLATQQTTFGEKVSIWGIAKDKEINFACRNFKTRLFVKKRNPFAIPSELKEAIKEKKGYAIFHIHGGWVPIFSSIGKLLNKYQIPFVLTAHGSYNEIAMERNFWVKKLYFYFFEKKLLHNASKIHCIGKSEIVGLNTLYQNNKAVLISYGFDNSPNIQIENQKKENIIFGFIGRLDIYTKGLDTLINAFEKFVQSNKTAQLWIVGDSNEKSKLIQMISDKNLQDNVLLLGSKFGLEKETILSQIDVFVHPSRNEGMPTSVIEAASYGKPCIVSFATNVGELIDSYNAGSMIYQQNSSELERALLKLTTIWKNPNEFVKLRLNAIKMVKENFNWEKIIQECNTKLYNV